MLGIRSLYDVIDSRYFAMRQKPYAYGKYFMQKKLVVSGRCALNGLGFDVVRSRRAEQY
jgi:hypothetical protein